MRCTSEAMSGTEHSNGADLAANHFIGSDKEVYYAPHQPSSAKYRSYESANALTVKRVAYCVTGPFLPSAELRLTTASFQWSNLQRV